MTRVAVGAACAVVPAEQLWKVLAAQRATHFPPRGERAAVAAGAGTRLAAAASRGVIRVGHPVAGC